MKRKILYVGLDVHKKTTDVAIATGRCNGKVRSYGKIDSTVNKKDVESIHFNSKLDSRD